MIIFLIYISGPNHGPQFTKCPSSLTFYAPSKKTEAVVSWEVPVATDIEDGILR
jgi:hypothetical protein